MLLLPLFDLILVGYECCKRAYRSCQGNDNIQNEAALPLIVAQVVIPPHQEAAAIGDLEEQGDH